MLKSLGVRSGKNWLPKDIILKCEVCGVITLLRVQIGWLDQHPIRIHCGKCGILISGIALFNQHEATSKFHFNNATHESEIRPDYYIEASGELLTEKMQKYEGKDEFVYFPPPFFTSFWEMGEENIGKFKERTLNFLNRCKNEWPRIRRINELWLSRNFTYIQQELEEILPKKQFPANNEFEYLRGVHQINLHFLIDIIDPEQFRTTTNLLWKEIDNLSTVNSKEILELAKYFGEQGLLNRYEEKIFRLVDQLVDKFQYMIPVFGLYFYSEINVELFKRKGITTASFEDLKQFYLDCYEVAGDVIKLVVSFNNLKYRGNFRQMADKRRDITTLDDFDKKAKAIRIGYVNGSEDFDQLIYPNLDNKLRNAIGHSTYKYDGIAQVITYYPSGTESSEDENRMYLVEFIRHCFTLFQCINNLGELVYQTRKLFLITQGNEPLSPSAYALEEWGRRKIEKVGRNEPCPCGSGLKFKRCCGK